VIFINKIIRDYAALFSVGLLFDIIKLKSLQSLNNEYSSKFSLGKREIPVEGEDSVWNKEASHERYHN